MTESGSGPGTALERRTIGHVLELLLAVSLSANPASAVAQASPTAPAASPAAVVAGPSDPCTSMSSLVSRPTFSTSPCVVKQSDLLIEAGYTNATTSGNGANGLVTYPQASIRAGIGRNLEFDIGPESIAQLSRAPPVRGTTDGTIGAAYEIGYSGRLVYGVNAAYTLSTGSAPFTGNGDGLLANLNAAYSLSPALGLFGTLGYNEQSAGSLSQPQRFHDVQPSAGASLSLPENVTAFVEAFEQSSTAPGLGGRFGFDTGFQADVGSRLQLDVNYFDYLGIENASHLHSVGFGAAYLFGS